MNNNEIIEVIEAVNNINATLYEQLTTKNKWGHEVTNYEPMLVVEYLPGQIIQVMFFTCCIYNSENEERDWIETGPSIQHESGVCTDDLVPAHYEPLEGYLRREVNKIIETISKIKL